MAQEKFAHLKNMKVDFGTSKDVRDTKMLDGGAEGNGFLDDNNVTEQYKTKSLEKKDMGGENNLNG